MKVKKYLLIVICTLTSNIWALSETKFKSHNNFCATNDCSNLPVHTAPNTVIIIHGMNSSLDTRVENRRTGGFVRMAKLLEDLGKDAQDYHVYGIDYSAEEYDLSGKQVKLVELNHNSTTCNAAGNWENCWKTLEVGENYHTPLNLTIREISIDTRNLLFKATQDGYIPKNKPITVITHSMGGLIIRDMLYNSESPDQKISGYEELMRAGIWINEYVSLATPHNHGFFAIDNPKLNALADFFTCKLFTKTIDALKIKEALLFQYCMLENWEGALNKSDVTWQDGNKVSISKIDFPQIRWVFAATTGERLMTDSSIGDGFVDYRSALYHKINDSTVRADKELIINEYADSGNFDPINDLNIGLTAIPGQKGNSIDSTYSGFPAYSNATHTNIYNVGFYTSNKLEECAYMPVTPGKYDGVAGCVGYFQYVIHSTNLCRLPGYGPNTEYYRRNPQFGPEAKGIDLRCSV